MAIRLNGWQRIGVVLSVIWFVGFGWFMWTSTVRSELDFYGNQLRWCKILLDTDNDALQHIPSPQEREKRQAANWAKYENCQKEARSQFDQTMSTAKASFVITLLAVDAASIVAGW